MEPALMLVHSSSPTNEWYDDFEKFAGLYGVRSKLKQILSVGRVNGIDLYIGWINGQLQGHSQR